MQDLIDTPLEEALEKLERRVTANKIELALQEIENIRARAELQAFLAVMTQSERWIADCRRRQLLEYEQRKKHAQEQRQLAKLERDSKALIYF